MLSVLLFAGRRCSRANSHPSRATEALRGRYRYLYNTIYLAPGPRATMTVARRLRQLDSKEISAVIIDYRRVKGREIIGVEKFGTHNAHTHTSLCVAGTSKLERTLRHRGIGVKTITRQHVGYLKDVELNEYISI